MSTKNKWLAYLGLGVLIAFMASASAYILFQLYGDGYLQGTQLKRMTDVLTGAAVNPWKYRILSDYIVNIIYTIFQDFNIPSPAVSAFVTFTVLEFAAIYSLAYVYFKKMNLSSRNALLGLAFISAAIIHSYYDSGLAYSRNVDLIFYLISALCLFYRKFTLFIFAVFLAALNRETSGFIMLMPFAFLMTGKFQKGEKKELIKYGIISIVVFVLVFVLLRYFINYTPPAAPYGIRNGWEMFYFNVTDKRVWLFLLLTFNVLPFIGLSRFKHWSKELIAIYLLIVPLWFLIHFFFSLVHETSLFLVPFVMAFIPSALCSDSSKAESLSN